MSWLIEDPTTTLVVGLVLEGFLAVALFQTGRGALVAAMGGVAVVLVLLLGFEWTVVTPREEVENTFDALAAALEANDLEAVNAYLGPNAEAARSQATSALERFEVLEARVRDLRIDVDGDRATARFRGMMALRDRRGESPYEHFLRDFTVHLRRSGDRWQLESYEDRPVDLKE